MRFWVAMGVSVVVWVSITVLAGIGLIPVDALFWLAFFLLPINMIVLAVIGLVRFVVWIGRAK